MKKKITLIGLSTLALFVFAQSAQAFTSISRATVPASALVGGTPEVTVTVNIRDTNDVFGANRSTLSYSGAIAGVNEWRMSNQCLVMKATITAAGGILQFYSRNTDGDASPKFADPTPGDPNNADSNPTGMLEGVTGDPDTGKTLSMAWSVKTSSKVVDLNDPNRGIGASDPNTGSGSGHNNRFQWIFLSDQATPDIPSTNTTAFSNGAEFVTLINEDKVHETQGPGGFTGNHVDGDFTFMYFETFFNQTQVNQNYQTTTLTLEAATL